MTGVFLGNGGSAPSERNQLSVVWSGREKKKRKEEREKQWNWLAKALEIQGKQNKVEEQSERNKMRKRDYDIQTVGVKVTLILVNTVYGFLKIVQMFLLLIAAVLFSLL